MRPYRGMTKDGKWVYGWYVKTRYPKIHWIIKDGLYVEDILIEINPKFPKHFQGCYKVIPETVGQFTGLKDKNGKEIYEGNIIKQGNNPDCWFAPRGVEFKNGAWMGRGIRIFVEQDKADYEGTVSNNEWEIIGDIHENPELLKDQK